MSKSSRIAALESRMAAAEGYIRAAGLMDAAPVPLAVGDTVEVTGPSNIGDHDLTGRVGKIAEIHDDGDRWVDTGDGDGRWFAPTSLRRVQPAPDVQPAAPAYTAAEADAHYAAKAAERQPAEQPAPAADLRREIEAAMESATLARMDNAICAAATVSPVARPGDERDDELRRQGYNIGIEAVQRKMLAALKGDTHEQR